DPKAQADAANAIVQGGKATYLRFQKDKYCSEDCIGDRHEAGGKCEPGGWQIIHVSDDDCGPDMLLHELGHKLGMIHEHARPDRDASVTVRWENMDKEAEKLGYDLKYAFGKAADPVKTYGSFDYASIMIYGSCEFSKSRDDHDPEVCAKGEESLVKKDG